MDETDGDEKDDVKRKSRNLSEKKRRDQFNLLINELSGMVTSNTRKMDKSTVLKATISFFRNQKELTSKAPTTQVKESWQPSFLSNEEFTHLMLEAFDGFIMTISCSGSILYTSDSITPLLGHLPLDLSGTPLWSLMPSDEQEELKRFLSNPALAPPTSTPGEPRDRYTIMVHLQKGGLFQCDTSVYERVHLTGYFEKYLSSSDDGMIDFGYSDGEETSNMGKPSRTNMRSSSLSPGEQSVMSIPNVPENPKTVFIAVGRLEQPHLLREMLVMENSKTEFTSRHSLEWKFLFLDHRAPTVIGYLPFEVLGTSGFDYYHVDDLEKVAACHDLLIRTGKGTSCHYRFLTKGQQWIWLQTQYYITYHQWNSKPEFIVCTNTVVSYGNVLKKNIGPSKKEIRATRYQSFEEESGNKKNSKSQMMSSTNSVTSSNEQRRFMSIKAKSVSFPPVSSAEDQYPDRQRKNYVDMKHSKEAARSSRHNPKMSIAKRMKLHHSKSNLYDSASSYREDSIDAASEVMSDVGTSSHGIGMRLNLNADEYSCIGSPQSDISKVSIASAPAGHSTGQDVSGNFHMYRKHEPPLSYDTDYSTSNMRVYICPPPEEPQYQVKRNQLNVSSVEDTRASPQSDQQPAIEGTQQSCSSDMETAYAGASDPAANAHLVNRYQEDPTQFPALVRVPADAPGSQAPSTSSIADESTSMDTRPSLYLTPEQQQLQAQLRQKHTELQQQILKQQEELQMVHQQLLMSQYGLGVQCPKVPMQYVPSVSSSVAFVSDSENAGCPPTNGCSRPSNLSSCEGYPNNLDVESQQYQSYPYSCPNGDPARNIQCTNVYIAQTVEPMASSHSFNLNQQPVQMLFREVDPERGEGHESTQQNKDPHQLPEK